MDKTQKHLFFLHDGADGLGDGGRCPDMDKQEVLASKAGGVTRAANDGKIAKTAGEQIHRDK